MALLVNLSFFTGEINIPNRDNASVIDNLNFFIGKYEPECLLTILGYPLYKVFGTEISQRMTSLLTGAEYNDSNGNLHKWKGLIYNTNNSLLAYYIYEHLARSKATVTTGTGNAIKKQEAADAAAWSDKIIFAQNAYSEGVDELLSFLWNYYINGVDAFPEINQFHYISVKRLIRKINGFGI